MAKGRKKKAEPGERALTLTLYLVRPDITAYTAAVTKDEDDESPPSYDLSPALPFKGRLFVDRTPPHPPGWQAFLEEGTTEEISGLNVSSAGALLLLKTKERMFALTFGQGRFMLSQDAIEASFGLKVALNTIDPDGLRSIDTANFEGVSKQRREQVSQASSMDNFAVEPAQDLLRSIVGRALDDTFARRLVGTDALTITCPMRFADLAKKCTEALAKSKEDAYKKHFPWVDHFRAIRGSEEYNRLDDLLVAAINGREHAKMHLAPPEIVDWTQLDRYHYSTEQRDARHDELDLEEYLATHGDLTRDHLREDHVWAYDSSGARMAVWTIRDSLIAEVADNDDTYVLMQGRWYAIERDYVKVVDAAVKTIPTATFTLPPCFKTEREEDYNERVCDGSKETLALLDQKFIKYPGKSKLEACDIFTDKGCFIHVKKGTKSSNLSHLFLQGTVSAQAFRSDESFRAQMREYLPKSHRALVPKTAPNPANFSVCYAIGTKGSAKIPLSLPFFSRVSLMQNARNLGTIGYPLSLAQIKWQV